MKQKRTVKFKPISTTMMAPCGMNCALCYAHMREKNQCQGCNTDDAGKPNSCVRCTIKNCEIIARGKPKFCFKCKKFPCARLKQLDKRYRTKYGMSMIANLENIKEFGIRNFVREEKGKWKCSQCGRTICVHRQSCIFCGQSRNLT
jgi:hypothetical protein